MHIGLFFIIFQVMSMCETPKTTRNFIHVFIHPPTPPQKKKKKQKKNKIHDEHKIQTIADCYLFFTIVISFFRWDSTDCSLVGSITKTNKFEKVRKTWKEYGEEVRVYNMQMLICSLVPCCILEMRCF